MLANGKDDLARAVSDYSDMTPAEAKKTVGESLWLENGSTLFLDTAALDSERQQIFSMGVMLTRVMEAQAMGGTEKEVAWLARGAAYLIGTCASKKRGSAVSPTTAAPGTACCRRRAASPMPPA